MELIEIREKGDHKVGVVKMKRAKKGTADKATCSRSRKPSYKIKGSALTSVYFTGQKVGNGYNTRKG